MWKLFNLLDHAHSRSICQVEAGIAYSDCGHMIDTVRNAYSVHYEIQRTPLIYQWNFYAFQFFAQRERNFSL
jgi:hypothetical protein